MHHYFFVFLFNLSIAMADAKTPSPLSEEIESKFQRPESSRILESWFSETENQSIRSHLGREVGLHCWKHSSNSDILAVAQRMWIHAPLSKSVQVVSQIDSYRDWIPGLLVSRKKVISKDHWETEWEQQIPFPIIPNLHYRMDYRVSSGAPTPEESWESFRYDLIEGNHLEESTGFILLRERSTAGDSWTEYTELDLLRPDFGPLKFLSRGTVQEDSIQGLMKSDVALKWRVEDGPTGDSTIKDRVTRWSPAAELIEHCRQSREIF